MRRLDQHNNHESDYTARKVPWKLVYAEVCSTKREALVRERVLKKYSRQQIEDLISSPRNVLNDLIQ